MKTTISAFLLLSFYTVTAQIPDHIYKPSIHSVKLYKAGNIYSYPIINLNSNEQMELHFDDLEGGVKNLYYTFQLCNADWSPAGLQPFDYIKGFQSTRLTTYRNSAISIVKYTHYQAIIPDKNSTPTRSGNYLLKVFRNNDTSDLFFTKRFLVVDNKVAITAQIKQPFSQQLYLSDQRVEIGVNTASAKVNVLSPQDIHLTVLQNNIWSSAAFVNKPNIFRGNYFEYNDDALAFQSGREWRWVDLRSMRLMSDRVVDMQHSKTGPSDIFVKPEAERKQQVYLYYRDLNGIYTIENSDGYNPLWQSDYSNVHFTFAPPGGTPYRGKDIYLFGELTNYLADDSSRMSFNADKGVYEKTLLLKQGYYNYSYVTMDQGKQPTTRFSLENTEGNFTNTENNYTILVYFRPFGGRADELIGYSQINTTNIR